MVLPSNENILPNAVVIAAYERF